MTPGRPGLHVAGMALANGTWSGPLLSVRAAYAALDDAGIGPSDIGAVIHVGGEEGAAAVRDGIGASACRRTFDVAGGPSGFVSALAVGASLLSAGLGVLITDVEGDGAASLVLVAGAPAADAPAADPLVVRATSPVQALLSSRAGGHHDVLLVAPGSDGASVRCLL